MPKKGDLVWVDDYMGDGKYSKRRSSNVAVISAANAPLEPGSKLLQYLSKP